VEPGHLDPFVAPDIDAAEEGNLPGHEPHSAGAVHA
jgi:hypothetical protein